MQKKIFLYILLSFVFCNGCNKSKKIINDNLNNNFKTIIIPKPIEIKDANIINDLDYIVLEAKEKSFFGHVTKLRTYKDRIFILDRRHAQAVLIYTIDGKHIATVGYNKGQGPLEFVKVHNFEIDYANNQLLVMDSFGSKFMIFDLDGNFVKRIDSKIPVTDAVLMPDGYIIHAKSSDSYKVPGQSDYKLIITDDNQNIINEGFEYDDNEKLNISCNSIICSLLNGGINFAPRFRDTIYSVSFDTICPKYAIDYGNNNKISKSETDGYSSGMELLSLEGGEKFCFLGNHVESNDYLYLYFELNSTAVFYNKSTNKTTAVSIKSENKRYYKELYGLLCSDDDGYFYGAFNFTPIDKLIETFPELKYLEDTDHNPILFRYKIKNE